jgi:hypothetical protein
MLRWRPIRDFTRKQGTYLIAGRFGVCECEYSEHFKAWRGMGNGKMITHWMPMPKPPKESA